MLTTMVIVPDGDAAFSERLNKELRKDWSAIEWEFRKFTEVKKPHLTMKTGTPYWVTIEEIPKKGRKVENEKSEEKPAE